MTVLFLIIVQDFLKRFADSNSYVCLSSQAISRLSFDKSVLNPDLKKLIVDNGTFLPFLEKSVVTKFF